MSELAKDWIARLIIALVVAPAVFVVLMVAPVGFTVFMIFIAPGWALDRLGVA